MSLQNKAGSIIIDATLTNVGRRLLSQGKLEITQFSLGDDEIEYSFGNRDSGEYAIKTAAPILEAPAQAPAAIKYGLMHFPRNDVLLIPHLQINDRLNTSVSSFPSFDPYASAQGAPEHSFLLSVNEETTKKLASIEPDFLKNYVLETDELMANTLIIESGIMETEGEGRPGTKIQQDRLLKNLGLYDDYIFIYADSRFIDKVLIPSSLSEPTKITISGKEVSSYQPLQEKAHISIPAPIENYNTYYSKTVENHIFAPALGSATDYSRAFSTFDDGARGILFPINFKVNPKMKSKSNGTADVRYAKFGNTSSRILGGTDLYDYVDTNVMFEGCSSGRTAIVTIRIIRYSGTG